MKILKIFGIVVGIHLFALILIFANPGCSTTKPSPSPSDTASTTTSPILSAPSSNSNAPSASNEPASTSSAISFNPDTPAAAPVIADSGVRFTPTRPGTPVAGALMTEPVADVTPASTYVVKAGDNLWTIARRNNTTVAQLTAANSLSPNASLRPGQKLIIPGKSPASAPSSNGGSLMSKSASVPTTSAASRSGTDVVKHVVKSGETLGAIARKYEVRQGELAVANNISDPARIRPGMELIIPGWKAPATGGKSSYPTNGAASASQPAANWPVNTAPSQSTPPPVPVIQVDESPAPAPQP